MNMRKLTVLTAGLLVSGLWAAVTIDPVARTITKNGGAYSVNTAGDGTWTATTDVDWITIKPRTTGNAGVSCVYIVAANKTADTRVGHININDNVHTVTQTGYDATLTPSSVTVDLNMHQGSVQIALDSGVSWTATANADWLTVYPNSGEGSGSVTYTVRSYDGQVPRNGSITIAGKTFTVTQNGIEIILTPEADSVSCSTDVAEVGVHALATTHWQVIPQTNWITVLDAGNGYGDDSVVLAVEENPSYYPRTGYVNIGSATYRLTQKGNDNVVVSISPESVEANESGAYGDIAVDITPSDAPWYAESKTPWLTVAEGSSGNGPGVVRYVASPNSTYADRDGLIRVKPVMQQPDPDYYAGLVCDARKTTYQPYADMPNFLLTEVLSRNSVINAVVPSNAKIIKFTGSEKTSLNGESIKAKDGNEFSFAFTFSVDELNRINRFVMIAGVSIYLNNSNQLCVDDNVSYWKAEYTKREYTVLLVQDNNGNVRLYAGEAGHKLVCVLSVAHEPILDFSNNVQWSVFTLGYTTQPSAGYLINGTLDKYRVWTRALTENEALTFDTYFTPEQEYAWYRPSVDTVPSFVPVCSKWRYYPFDESLAQNQYGTFYTNRNYGPVQGGFVGVNVWQGHGESDRFGIAHKAISMEENGWAINISDTRYLATIKSNNGYVYPLKTVSMSFWLYVDRFPASIGTFGYSSSVSGSLTLNSENEMGWTYTNDVSRWLSGSTRWNDCIIPANEWIMLTVVLREASATFYLDGQEVGNTSYYCTNNFSYCRIGGWHGRLDDWFICDSAMTSEEVLNSYEASRLKDATHCVHQGYIVPALTETNMVVEVDGGTTNVGLSIGSRVAWTATENASWLHITSPKSGTGPTILTFDIDANPRVEERVGTLTIADVVLTVRQRGLWAEVEADTTVAEVDGGYGFVTVTTEADALWSATSHADWLTIVDGEESQGVGQVMWVADPYTDSTHSRIGSMTVAAHKIYITQRGYELSVSTNGVEVSSSSANGQIDVSSPPGTEWSVMATEPWITITSGSTGVGSGTVRYTVAENTSGVSRTGSIIVSGEEYVITQTSTVNVNVQIAGFGSVSGAGTYEQHSVVELIATPDEGYVFSHWSGDVNGNTNRLSVIVDRAKDVVATFIPVAAADQIAADRGGVAEGLYTRDQIHALEMGSLLFDVDSSSNKARVGVMLMETSDLADPNWQPVGLSIGDIDVGTDGSVGLNVPATGNAKFFKVVVPDNN